MPSMTSSTTLARLQQYKSQLQSADMSLCFLKAFTKSKGGSITQEEYIRHLASHFRGVRHPEDSIPSVGEPLASFEPWSASLRELALSSDYSALEDTSEHEKLLDLCFSGQLEEFKPKLASLRSHAPKPDLLQPAACLAAQRQHLDILQYCLEQGAIFDRFLTRAAQIGARGNIKFLEVLLERDWAGIQHSPDAVQAQIKHFGEESMEAKWLKTHAAKGATDGKSGMSAETKKNTDDKSQGRDASKGTGSRDPKQGYTPEQIQEWFGDVDW